MADQTPDELSIDEAERQGPQWYRRTGLKFGNIWLHRAAGVAYAIVVLAPLVYWASTGGLPSGRAAVVLAVVIALGWPTWVWFETIAFERWVRSKPKAERGVERAYFKLMTDNAKAFWTAIFAIYAAAAAIGFRLDSAGR